MLLTMTMSKGRHLFAVPGPSMPTSASAFQNVLEPAYKYTQLFNVAQLVLLLFYAATGTSFYWLLQHVHTAVPVYTAVPVCQLHLHFKGGAL